MPDGKRLVSEKNLLERQKPNVTVGEDTTYGMGLESNTEYGVTVVHHGGSLFGYKSDMFWLPEYGVGGVLLTNSDDGYVFLRAFYRKVLEEMFDGKPEASGDIDGLIKLSRTSTTEERAHLTIPADASVTRKLAARYTSRALGDIKVSEDKDGDTWFDFGEARSRVATRKNDDGTMSIVTITPGIQGVAFVIADKEGKRRLIIRDAQHEYVFTEK